LPITSFVGRAEEMAEIRSLLLRLPAGRRLITLTGSGGCGKTRLALALGSTLLPSYDGGVWLVDLAPLTDPALVPHAVITALRLREGGPQSNGQDAQALLIEALKDQHMLLVLDNCEHVLGAVAGLVQALLQCCPSLNILATSREGLGLAEETTWLVPSMTLPPHPHHALAARSGSAADMQRYSAVALFIERAQASRPGFALTEMNAAAVARICTQLDGIPLAIELAAAQVRAIAVEDLAARLDDRFRLLTSGNRAALPRHRTLQAVMDWSYALLDELERIVLQRLSVFGASGCTREAAAAICLDASVAAHDMSQHFCHLVAKSLLYVEKQEDGGSPRYRMLETVCQYARARLTAVQLARLQQAHAFFFLTLAEEAEPQLTGPDQVAWLRRLEQDHDNLRAALSWACAGGEQVLSPMDVRDSCDRYRSREEVGLRLAGALWRLWLVHGHLTEGSTWLEAVLKRGAGVKGPSRGKALNGVGNLAWALGHYERAIAIHTENLTLRQEIGDKAGVAGALRNLGNVAGDQGDYERAARFHGESLALSRALGSNWDIASALSNLGNVRKEQGHYGEARALYEESLRLRRHLGDQRGIGMSLANLGNVMRYQGDNETAALFYEESLALRRELDDRRGIVVVLNNLGRITRERGDSDRAAPHYAESLDLLRSLGDRLRLAECLEGIAGLALERGHLDRAARLHASAAALRAALGAPLPPNEQATIEREVAALRAALGEDAAAMAEATGRVMTPEQAIEDAFEEVAREETYAAQGRQGERG
jgi:non-specific serine/threonine protein kinase